MANMNKRYAQRSNNKPIAKSGTIFRPRKFKGGDGKTYYRIKTSIQYNGASISVELPVDQNGVLKLQKKDDKGLLVWGNVAIFEDNNGGGKL